MASEPAAGETRERWRVIRLKTGGKWEKWGTYRTFAEATMVRNTFVFADGWFEDDVRIERVIVERVA